MSKIAVVYFTQTGNTEEMAKAVKEGAEAAGAEVELFDVSDGFDRVDEFDAIAFGCPAMGDEEIESDVFQPIYDECKGKLGDKKVALFGSYGWGDGDWMATWTNDAKDAGLNLVCESVIANEAPDDDAVEACKKLGAALA